MTDFDEKVAVCALNRIFGYEPAVTHALMDHFGSALAVFNIDEEELTRLFGPFSKLRPRIRAGELETSRRELERLEAEGYRFLPVSDSDFPALLKECPDSPAGLYLRSDSSPADIFADRPFISIVGTRDISPYGREWCRRIVQTLSDAGTRPTIVSGLAFGVDVTAHQAALECSLPTIGVMATGIDRVYPARHSSIAALIARTRACALITDYPPDTGAQAIRFIRRNRIIAGLAGSTILVESKARGGGLITASQAFCYNRNVFALPGRLDDIRSAGCNRLIKEKVAEPVGELESLVGELGLGKLSGRKRPMLEEEITRQFASAVDEETLNDLIRVAMCIKSNRGIQVEELCDELGMDYRSGSGYTSMLECKGIIYIDLLQRCSILYKNV